MSGSDVAALIDRLGVPIVALLGIGLVAWRFFFPVAKTLVEKHVEAIDALMANTARTTEVIVELREMTRAQRDFLAERSGYAARKSTDARRMLVVIGEGVAKIGNKSGVDLTANVEQLKELARHD